MSLDILVRKSLSSFDIHGTNVNAGNESYDGLWWDKDDSIGNTRVRHTLRVATDV